MGGKSPFLCSKHSRPIAGDQHQPPSQRLLERQKMNRSETIKELAVALSVAQSEMKGAVKNAINPHLGSKYANLTSIIEAVKPTLTKHGISFVQCAEPSESVEVRLTTCLIHSSGQWLESTITVPTTKKDAQGYGSAMTYARRYALAAMLGIPQEDDDGIAASKPAKKSGSATKIAFDNLSDEMKAEVKTVADQVASVMLETEEQQADPKQAIEIMEMFCESYPEDETLKPAIWSQLDSKFRTAIKKYQTSVNGA